MTFKQSESDTTFTNIVFSETDITEAINDLKASARSQMVSLQCFLKTAKTLAMLWRKSLDTGMVPKKLKAANITPICKGEDKSHPKNCTPALTFHISKIFEKILRK